MLIKMFFKFILKNGLFLNLVFKDRSLDEVFINLLKRGEYMGFI